MSVSWSKLCELVSPSSGTLRRNTGWSPGRRPSSSTCWRTATWTRGNLHSGSYWRKTPIILAGETWSSTSNCRYRMGSDPSPFLLSWCFSNMIIIIRSCLTFYFRYLKNFNEAERSGCDHDLKWGLTHIILYQTNTSDSSLMSIVEISRHVSLKVLFFFLINTVSQSILRLIDWHSAPGWTVMGLYDLGCLNTTDTSCVQWWHPPRYKSANRKMCEREKNYIVLL